jgi:DNA-binding transcriptional regulator YiaG
VENENMAAKTKKHRILTEPEKNAIRKLDKMFSSMLATAFRVSRRTIGGILAWNRNPKTLPGAKSKVAKAASSGS